MKVGTARAERTTILHHFPDCRAQAWLFSAEMSVDYVQVW